MNRDLRNGFTLAEMVIVVLIMGAVLAFVMQDHFRRRPHYLLQRATLEMVNDLRRSRMTAISRNLRVSIGLGTNTHGYSIWVDTNGNGVVESTEIEVTALPGAVRLKVDAGGTNGAFTSRGAFDSVGGYWNIRLSNAVDDQWVYIMPNGQVDWTDESM